VRIWYVAIVTGRMSLCSPEYSPISASVSDVWANSSLRHCRADTVLVTRISVRADAVAIAPAPTKVLPAPQGRTTTPVPDAKKASMASRWYGRSAKSGSSSRRIGWLVPST
jgi:hypothetical protein